MMLWGRAAPGQGWGAPRKDTQGAPSVQQPKDPEPGSGLGCRDHGGEAQTPPRQGLPLRPVPLH